MAAAIEERDADKALADEAAAKAQQLAASDTRAFLTPLSSG